MALIGTPDYLDYFFVTKNYNTFDLIQEDSESEENLNFDDSNENGESSDYFEPDDESTIDEQESFEALNNEVVTNQENEILVLEQVIFFKILKISFSKKATKFETIFHLILSLLRRCQIIKLF